MIIISLYLYVNNLEDYYGIGSPIGRIVAATAPMRVTSYSDATPLGFRMHTKWNTYTFEAVIGIFPLESADA